MSARDFEFYKDGVLGDQLYRSASGLYVPARGTPGVGKAVVIAGDGIPEWTDIATQAELAAIGGGSALYTEWDHKIPDVSPHALTDEFSSNTIGNYTTVYGNGDSTAVVDIHSTKPYAAYFFAPSIQYHQHSLLRALPAGDFSIYTSVTLAASGADSTFAGIILSTASTAGSGVGTAQVLGRSTPGGNVQITERVIWNGFGSTAAGAAAAGANFTEYPTVVLRIRRVSTTVTRSYSVDGKTWLGGQAITDAAWTHFGIFLQNYSGADARATFDYLRYYSSGTQDTTGGTHAIT